MSAEGWGYIANSKKWHYYADGGVSLCRKFMKFTQHDLEQGSNNSPDNCAECKRRLAALNVKEPTP
jgi:hypothetical protein